MPCATCFLHISNSYFFLSSFTKFSWQSFPCRYSHPLGHTSSFSPPFLLLEFQILTDLRLTFTWKQIFQCSPIYSLAAFWWFSCPCFKLFYLLLSLSIFNLYVCSLTLWHGVHNMQCIHSHLQLLSFIAWQHPPLLLPPLLLLLLLLLVILHLLKGQACEACTRCHK